MKELLSGGEKQRVIIITSLLLRRKVFLLDEITAALNERIKDKVIEYFITNPEWTVLAVSEAILPYLRKSVSQALSPIIATMATMGIVFLPGMMTGQIIGGSSPLVAVKYQIAIMIAIFTAVTISIITTILMTTRISFFENGILKKEAFRTF